MDTIRRLIVRMAPENREWGDTRIRGARGNLGQQVARGPLANVRKERGLAPAPDRKTRTTWRECLAAHGDVRAAADCCTVEVWTPRGLTRFPVLGLMHLASRHVPIAGISAEPDGPGVPQLMRNAPDAEDGCLRHIRVLIHDRDPRFRPAGRDFVAHDHHERNRQGLAKRRILPLSTAPPPRGRVPCRQRLGGMLHDDSRSAA